MFSMEKETKRRNSSWNGSIPSSIKLYFVSQGETLTAERKASLSDRYKRGEKKKKNGWEMSTVRAVSALPEEKLPQSSKEKGGEEVEDRTPPKGQDFLSAQNESKKKPFFFLGRKKAHRHGEGEEGMECWTAGYDERWLKKMYEKGVPMNRFEERGGHKSSGTGGTHTL